MKDNAFYKFRALAFVICVLTSISICADANASDHGLSRYDPDFTYQGFAFKILSETEHTVAVTADDMIDSYGARVRSDVPFGSLVGDDGFLMSEGIYGRFVVIPDTVYDRKGTAYTVTEFDINTIWYDWIESLVLPPTMINLNDGIAALPLTSLYLPTGLKKLSGIADCKKLKSLTIPWGVETIDNYSLYYCGLENIFLPPNVKTMGRYVLSECDSLRTAALSKVETMGAGCFRGCATFAWANLPETLKSMGDGCFNDCPELRRVSLPWSEIRMNDCFNGCPSVECIEILAAEPYPFPENCFNDVDRANCDLLVPVESLEKYMQADGWKDFFRINGVLTGNVSVKSVKKGTGFVATGGQGTLKIYNADGITLDIVSMDGRKMATVAKTGSVELSIPAGVYIVSSGSGSTKVRVL